MFGFLILFVLVACAYGASFNPLALRGFEDRIFGGVPINITVAPYQVALLYDSAGTGSYSLRYGGSIYSRDTVVTAAHSVTGTNPLRWKIRAGTETYNSGGQLVDVASYKIHENYSSVTIDYDVSVLKLSSNLSLDNYTAKAIPLNGVDVSVPDNSTALASGWGPTVVGGSIPDQLHAVNISIINQEVCRKNYAGYITITDTMICAGHLEHGGVGPCHLDYGGPLAVDGILVGIMSWARGCNFANSSAVSARVSVVREWIDANSL